MKQLNSLKELQEGKEYSIYCKQFDVINKARFISGDTTILKRDIGYFQFSERGNTPVSKLQLKTMLVNNTYPHTIFALWGFDLNQNTITETN